MPELARAVHRYGESMLLFVWRADERHPPFAVRLVRPGLMIGHIDWFAPDRCNLPANLGGRTRLREEARRIRQNRAPGRTGTGSAAPSG